MLVQRVRAVADRAESVERGHAQRGAEVAVRAAARPALLYRLSEPTADLARQFEEPDDTRFPSLRLAREAIAAGGTAPTLLNAANEIAVAAFLDGRLCFPHIAAVVEETLTTLAHQPADTLEAVLADDSRARETAARLVERRTSP